MTEQESFYGVWVSTVSRPDDSIDLVSDGGDEVLYVNIANSDGDNFIGSVMQKMNYPSAVKFPNMLGSFSQDTSGMICHGYEIIGRKFYVKLTDPLGLRNEEQQEFDSFEEMLNEHGFCNIKDSFELFTYINLTCKDMGKENG